MTTRLIIMGVCVGVLTFGGLPLVAVTYAQEQAPHTELPVRTQQRVQNLASNMANRFDATLIRLDRINARLSARMEILEAEGADLSAARNHLKRAQDTITRTRLILTGIDAKILATVTSSTPKEAWVELRATFVEAKNLVIEAHADIRQAFALTKDPAQITIPTSATSTAPHASSTQP